LTDSRDEAEKGKEEARRLKLRGEAGERKKDDPGDKKDKAKNVRREWRPSRRSWPEGKGLRGKEESKRKLPLGYPLHVLIEAARGGRQVG